MLPFLNRKEKKMTCEDCLGDQLKDGEWHLVDWVRVEFKKTGFKKSEFKAARKNLGVETFHQQEDDINNWFWRLRK